MNQIERFCGLSGIFFLCCIYYVLLVTFFVVSSKNVVVAIKTQKSILCTFVINYWIQGSQRKRKEKKRAKENYIDYKMLIMLLTLFWCAIWHILDEHISTFRSRISEEPNILLAEETETPEETISASESPNSSSCSYKEPVSSKATDPTVTPAAGTFIPFFLIYLPSLYVNNYHNIMIYIYYYIYAYIFSDLIIMNMNRKWWDEKQEGYNKSGVSIRIGEARRERRWCDTEWHQWEDPNASHKASEAPSWGLCVSAMRVRTRSRPFRESSGGPYQNSHTRKRHNHYYQNQRLSSVCVCVVLCVMCYGLAS